MRLCPTYLRDPIFDHNNIEYLRDSSKYHPSYELKLVEFQYFTRKLEFVKVVRCPVKVDNFVTRLHFLEINHSWNFSGPRRGYFVFINKVVPQDEKSRQPLQLLMYVYPPKSKFPAMKTTGKEAELRDAVDLVSPHTMKLRLRERSPLQSSRFEPRTGLIYLIFYRGYSEKNCRTLLVLQSTYNDYEIHEWVTQIKIGRLAPPGDLGQTYGDRYPSG